MLSGTKPPREGRAPVNKSPTAAVTEKSEQAKNLYNKSKESQLQCDLGLVWKGSFVQTTNNDTTERDICNTARPAPPNGCPAPGNLYQLQRRDNDDARKQMACLTFQPLYPRGRSPSNHSLDYRWEWTVGALVLTKVSQSVRSQTVHPVPLEVFPLHGLPWTPSFSQWRIQRHVSCIMRVEVMKPQLLELSKLFASVWSDFARTLTCYTSINYDEVALRVNSVKQQQQHSKNGGW